MTATATPTLLENGAVMGREQFHRLFEDCEELERVELIEGVVYMPSPVKLRKHSRQGTLMIAWLVAYEILHEGQVEAADSASVLLDEQNEPIPDAMLFRLKANSFEDDYLKGAPELIVEVANSSLSRDLHQKKEAYRRNGVREYIVWRVRDNLIDWFQLSAGEYVLRSPDEVGIIESIEFPGLRLDVAAALANNRKKVLDAVRPG